MRNYELVLVLNPELTEEAQENTLQRIGSWITERGGNISQQDKWGRKKLAYPVRKFLEGSYVLTRFAADPSQVREVETDLRRTEEVLRYLLVKIEDKGVKESHGQSQ